MVSASFMVMCCACFPTNCCSFKAVVETAKATGYKIMQAAPPGAPRKASRDRLAERYERLATIADRRALEREEAARVDAEGER